MKSQRPYLLRAFHEWITDSGCTPYVVVDATAPEVDVPPEHVRDGQIVLNLSWGAVGSLTLGDDTVACTCRFGGVPRSVVFPVQAVVAIYARENGQGLAFPDEPDGTDGDDGGAGEGPDDDGPDGGTSGSGSRKGGPTLTVVK